MPELHEVQPVSTIEFEIPEDHPAAVYDMQVRSSDDELEKSLAMTGVRCPTEVVPFENEVTCFHLLAPVETMDGSLIYLNDVYVTKEHTKIVADLASFKSMFDHVAHEISFDGAVGEVSVDPDSRSFPFHEDVKSAQYMTKYQGDITLLRTDRSGKEHSPHRTVATYFPSQKSVTRPSANDEFSFFTFVQNSPDTLLSAINLMIADPHMAM